MGTRSTVKFYEGETCILCVYQQYDGYIDGGVGHKLAGFLKGRGMLKGFQEQTMETHANGMSCLAAQYIAKFKTCIGNLYIGEESDSEDYGYEVRHNSNDFEITVLNWGESMFKATPEGLLEIREFEE